MGFYSENHVMKGRTIKTCCMCGKTINKGEPAYTIPDNYFESNYHMCDPCHDKCEQDGIDNIEDVKKYDDEDDE